MQLYSVPKRRLFRPGIRQDLQRSKEETGYNPAGVGNAYSHNFLNQACFTIAGNTSSAFFWHCRRLSL